MRTTIAFLTLLCGVFHGLAEAPAATMDAALAGVEPESVYRLCRQIAQPEFAGRLTGHPGFTAAARWAAERYAGWGLQPVDSANDFLQPFPAPHTVIDSAAMTLVLPGGEAAGPPREVALQAGQDFLPLLCSGTAERDAGLVFAGWGIHAPEAGYDDYAGVDVAGKFVLCFRGTPADPDERFTEHDQHRTRLRTALKMGAVGLIYIYLEVQANPNGLYQEGFLPAEISESVADRILAGIGTDSTRLRQELSGGGKPLSRPLPGRIRFKVESRHFPDSLGYNIAGWIEGSDPTLKAELIVVGAHFDHCGTHLGMHFPGANDNASGSAAVMEMARVVAALPKKPARSIAFVLFGGEETGLQGCHRFAEGLPYRFQKVAAMINLDMVGEGDGAWCGFSQHPELVQALDAADARLKLLRGRRPITRVGVRSSDFAPFFQRGIPCLNFSSNGPHQFYHQTGDSYYRINPDILADLARLTTLVLLHLAG